jgi:hypothetical protein
MQAKCSGGGNAMGCDIQRAHRLFCSLQRALTTHYDIMTCSGTPSWPSLAGSGSRTLPSRASKAPFADIFACSGHPLPWARLCRASMTPLSIFRRSHPPGWNKAICRRLSATLCWMDALLLPVTSGRSESGSRNSASRSSGISPPALFSISSAVLTSEMHKNWQGLQVHGASAH